MTKEVSIGELKAWVMPAQGKARARVLVVHGLGEHSGRHMTTASHLVAKGIEVVRFDQRGCGQSHGPRQWIERFDDYADDVLSVIAWTKSSLPQLPLFLLGHSLGGAVAIHAAASESAPLAGLILSAPAHIPGAGVSPIKIFVGKLLEKALPKLKVPGTLDVSAISRDAAVVEAYRRDPLNCSFNTVRQGNEILRALETLPNVCHRIKSPVLIAHGDADRLVKIEGSTALLAALGSRDKTMKTFAGGYHELHNDLDRESYFATVDSWIEARIPRD